MNTSWLIKPFCNKLSEKINNKNNEHDSKWAPLKLSLRNTVEIDGYGTPPSVAAPYVDCILYTSVYVYVGLRVGTLCSRTTRGWLISKCDSLDIVMPPPQTHPS